MAARITPLTEQDLPQFANVVRAIKRDHGHVPNSFLTLGHHPDFLKVTGTLADAVWYVDSLPNEARALIGFAFSWFSGVMYAATHLASYAQDVGLVSAKLRTVDEWETSPIYTEAERVVLRLCRQAARMPGEVDNATINEVHNHWSEDQLMVIVGLISWHAFLNRWNAIIATDLADIPFDRAKETIGKVGWNPFQHIKAGGQHGTRS